MCRMNKLLVTLFLWGTFLTLEAQEAVRWTVSPAPFRRQLTRTESAGDTVALPFYDEFSSIDSGLSPVRWLPSPAVLLNNTMAAYPPSFGFATFDGLNAARQAYQPGYHGNRSFPTDTLTSRPIALGGLFDADSVVFSFFVNSGGVGDPPEDADSLVLQFRADSLWSGTGWARGRWTSVWHMQGDSAPTWQYVALPIRNTATARFFHDGFQFRFIRYGNPGGNLDLWHIDYIYLDRDRTATNDLVDVSVVNGYPSVLKEYTAMPWAHFIRRPADYMADSLFCDARNLTDAPRNVSFRLVLRDAHTGKEIYASPSYALNLNPGLHYFPFRNNFEYWKLDDSMPAVRISYYAQTFPDNFPGNDSAAFVQSFGDFFAYDDGSSEAGYGLVNTSYGKVAIRFHLAQPDTIRAIAMAFNTGIQPTPGQVSFHPAIWKLVSPGGPEQLIYQGPRQVARFAPRIGDFYYYALDTTLVLDGDVYVGWIQTEDVFLNVGLDMNYPQRHRDGNPFPHLYYYTRGSWKRTSLAAVPLIRLVRGNPTSPIAGLGTSDSPRGTLSAFPNPFTGIFQIKAPVGETVREIIIYTLTGKEMMRWRGRQPQVALNGQAWPTGSYAVRVFTSRGIYRMRLVKR